VITEEMLAQVRAEVAADKARAKAARTKVFLIDERPDGDWYVEDVRLWWDNGGLANEVRNAIGLTAYHRERRCAACGRRYLGHRSRRYCSDECRKPAKVAAAKKQTESRRTGKHEEWVNYSFTCETCGKKDTWYRKTRRYCSDACRQMAYRRRV
jgi:endogenous inhibitor of DNA gyrase (YacG/DUF329 family)